MIGYAGKGERMSDKFELIVPTLFGLEAMVS